MPSHAPHRRLFTSFQEWLFTPVSASALGYFRLCFGVFFLVYWLSKWSAVTALFSADGLVIGEFDRGLPDVLLYMVQFPPPAWTTWMLYVVLLLSLVGMATGFLLRVSSGVALVIAGYFWILSGHLFPHVAYRLFLLFTLFFMMSGADRALSVTMWRRHGHFFMSERISPFIQRLMQIQIAFLYLAVGWQKVTLPSWHGPEPLYYSLMSASSTWLALWIVRQGFPMWLYGIGVFIVKVWECAFPFGVWIPWLRPWFLLFGIAFHTAVMLLYGFWSFMILLPAYVLFLPPEAVAEVFRKTLKLRLHRR